MTTEWFRVTTANAKSFVVKTKTPSSTTSDHREYRYFTYDLQQHSKPATVLARKTAALFTGVCCTSPRSFSASRRPADSESLNKVNSEAKMSRNSRDSQQTPKTRSYRLTTSSTRGRVSHDARPHTALSTETARRRLRSSNDDARELQKQQARRSINPGAVTQKIRRRPPLVIDEIATKDSSQPTDNSSQLGGWSGDPEVLAEPLANKVTRDFANKYFVGKRHSAHKDGLASGFNLAQRTDSRYR